MVKSGKHAILFILATIFLASAALAKDVCAICGKEITDTVYLVTDEVTGEKQEVCADCLKLPRCFICGLPVKTDGLALADGRYLCARDKATAVLTAADAQQVASAVQDSLQKLFARFTDFPTNVDVEVLDRIDVDRMSQPGGNDFESPNLLGCISAEPGGDPKQYSMHLMTGLPLAELKATAAHDFSHAWVGDNVSPNRRKLLSRDAEEGFCELVAYLLMDSQNEEAQKQFILKNRYTRGQVELFIQGNNLYGFDQILDWMRYGDTSKLDPDHLDKIRDVVMPKPGSIAGGPMPVRTPSQSEASVLTTTESKSALIAAPAALETVKLQGIMWGKTPSAIINSHTVFSGDQFRVAIGAQVLNLRCLEIRKNSVRIENLETGMKQELQL